LQLDPTAGPLAFLCLGDRGANGLECNPQAHPNTTDPTNLWLDHKVQSGLENSPRTSIYNSMFLPPILWKGALGEFMGGTLIP
jgi:hypothetical protein